MLRDGWTLLTCSPTLYSSLCCETLRAGQSMQFMRGFCRLAGKARAAQLKPVVFCVMASGSQAPRRAHADPQPVLADVKSPIATQYSLPSTVVGPPREHRGLCIDESAPAAYSCYAQPTRTRRRPAEAGQPHRRCRRGPPRPPGCPGLQQPPDSQAGRPGWPRCLEQRWPRWARQPQLWC